MSSLDYDVGSKGVVHEPQSEQKEFALRPVDHMKYIQNLSAKPLRVIVNDFHMSKHGHAIVRRPESVERSHGVRALDAFLIHNITEEVIYDTNNTMHKAHRVFVASGSGGAYCDVGWMVWEEVHNCMRCGIAICDTISKDKHHCTSCGDIVCTPCGSHFAAVKELQSPEKFRVCSKCYKSEDAKVVVRKVFRRLSSMANVEAPEDEIAVIAERLTKATIAHQQTHDKQDQSTNTIGHPTATIATTTDSHLAFIRSLSRKPISEVRKAYDLAKQGRALLQRRASFTLARGDIIEAFIISRMTVEVVPINKAQTKRAKLYRVFVTSTGGGHYCNVGWVLVDSVTHCLRCRARFGLLSTKHSCVACGDVVCHQCSPHKAVITELRSEVPHRVCNTCFGIEARSDGRISATVDALIAQVEEEQEQKRHSMRHTVSDESLIDAHLQATAARNNAGNTLNGRSSNHVSQWEKQTSLEDWDGVHLPISALYSSSATSTGTAPTPAVAAADLEAVVVEIPEDRQGNGTVSTTAGTKVETESLVAFKSSTVSTPAEWGLHAADESEKLAGEAVLQALLLEQEQHKDRSTNNTYNNTHDKTNTTGAAENTTNGHGEISLLLDNEVDFDLSDSDDDEEVVDADSDCYASHSASFTSISRSSSQQYSSQLSPHYLSPLPMLRHNSNNSTDDNEGNQACKNSNSDDNTIHSSHTDASQSQLSTQDSNSMPKEPKSTSLATSTTASSTSVLALDSHALDEQGLLSSDGSTAVIPIDRLNAQEHASLLARGYLPTGSSHAFVPLFKLHLRHVEPNANKRQREEKKFVLPQVKLQPVSALPSPAKTLSRRPSEAEIVKQQLRSVKSMETLAMNSLNTANAGANANATAETVKGSASN